MWLLTLRYEFYNPRFYDTKRNFSHQGQRQEKWDRISEMGLGRGEGFRMTETANRANFLMFTSLSNLRNQLQNVKAVALSLHPKAKSPQLLRFDDTTFPRPCLPSNSPSPNHTF